MRETFTCEGCGGTFPIGDDAAARDELQQRFGDVDPADCAMFCDDCYRKLAP